MADWSVIRSTLATWVGDITGLPVHWRRRPNSFSFSSAHVVLDIIGRRSKGLRDDLSYVYDDTEPAGERIVYSSTGHRVFTLSVQVRSQRTADDLDALHYTSLIRDSIRLPQRSHDVFAAADIAFNTVLSETEIADTIDGRDESIAVIDISFNATASAVDTGATFIEKAKNAELQIPEGTTVWTGDLDVE